jgi:histidinol-phosphate phosphatase family protein
MAEKGGKVVFVDRDGVLNQDYVGDYVKRWEDFHFLPGVLEALRALKEAGFHTVIISNQAGVGDGVYAKEALDEVTRRMLAEIRKAGGEVAAAYYCLHGKNEGCDCRKPKTGLFRKASRDFHCEPSRTFFIGDKISDIRAGKNFGLRTILALTGYGAEHRKEITEATRPDFIAGDFSEAIRIVLGENG